MGEIGREAAIELADLAHHPEKVARIEAAAALDEAKRQQ